MTAAPKLKHPAQYTPAIVDHMIEVLGDRRGTLFDPFAGPGQSLPRFKAPGRRVIGYEIEKPWADLGAPLVRHGDSTRTHFRRGSVAMMAFSVCYGNRFADSHNARERCSKCVNGEIITVEPGSRRGRSVTTVTSCEACGGTGIRNHTRRSYTHDLRAQTGDPNYRLAENNAGTMLYGRDYQDLHRTVYEELWRIARPASEPGADDGCELLLNVSDFYRTRRKGEPQQRIPATVWHCATLCAIGWEWTGGQIIDTPRMRYGANNRARVDGEWVHRFRRPPS